MITHTHVQAWTRRSCSEAGAVHIVEHLVLVQVLKVLALRVLQAGEVRVKIIPVAPERVVASAQPQELRTAGVYVLCEPRRRREREKLLCLLCLLRFIGRRRI